MAQSSPDGSIEPVAEDQRRGTADFTPSWAGQTSPLGELPARQLTAALVTEAAARFADFAGGRG